MARKRILGRETTISVCPRTTRRKLLCVCPFFVARSLSASGYVVRDNNEPESRPVPTPTSHRDGPSHSCTPETHPLGPFPSQFFVSYNVLFHAEIQLTIQHHATSMVKHSLIVDFMFKERSGPGMGWGEAYDCTHLPLPLATCLNKTKNIRAGGGDSTKTLNSTHHIAQHVRLAPHHTRDIVFPPAPLLQYRRGTPSTPRFPGPLAHLAIRRSTAHHSVRTAESLS
jgi:hypothetical protein